MTTNFFSPLLFLDPGSGMGKNQDPGSRIRDKHPGSATLGELLLSFCSLGLLSPCQAVYPDGDSVPDALLIRELLLSFYSLGLLSPRQAVYPDRDSVPDALPTGEILLSLYSLFRLAFTMPSSLSGRR